VTLALTLDRVEVTLVRITGRGLSTHQIRSKSKKKTFCGRTYGRTDGRTDIPEFSKSIRSSPCYDLTDTIMKTQENAWVAGNTPEPVGGNYSARHTIADIIGGCCPSSRTPPFSRPLGEMSCALYIWYKQRSKEPNLKTQSLCREQRV